VHLSPSAVETVAAVESLLTVELRARRTEVTAIDGRLGADVDRLVAYISGGKRLRPQFLYSGWLAASRADVTENAGSGVPVGVIQAAAALELIQACALIHDDIIDRSDTRRGRPSVHRSVEKLHADSGWSGDAAHFGVSAALLIGDLALAWADDLFVAGLSGLGGPAEAFGAWRAMRTEVLAGQLLDLRITADEAADPQTAAADATIVNRYKTAAYTVERPLHLGAALAHAGPATVGALRRYGQAIGVAFQLRDDLLGVFGDPAVTGKPAGGDLIEGKRTVLLAMARAALAGSAHRLAELDHGIGTSLGPAEIDRLTQLVAETGAPQAIEARISALLSEGLAALEATDSGGRPLIRSEAASDLRALALAATSRER
jgi:geranylgeranyl diphosphate synthase type I